MGHFKPSQKPPYSSLCLSLTDLLSSSFFKFSRRYGPSLTLFSTESYEVRATTACRGYLLSDVDVDPLVLIHVYCAYLLTAQYVLGVSDELQGLLFKVKGSKIASFLVDSIK